MDPLLILALLIPIEVLGHQNHDPTRPSPGPYTFIHHLCKPTVTEVSGTFAPSSFCSGDLIFEDNFDDLNMEKWQHENNLAGGGNWEFQWYNNNRTNSFTKDGILFIRPSLLADQFGDNFLTSGNLNVNGGAPADECTNSLFYGCERTGTPSNVLNPIKSARIRTVHSFSLQYGKVEVRAKMPSGDWLWPAIWMMPAFNKYGTWPSSGEIDILESRGNKRLTENGINIGTQQVGSTLQFGPYPELNKWDLAHWTTNNDEGFDTKFHRYQMEWTPDYMKFSIDDIELGTITPPKGGFWEHGNFSSYNIDNPWTAGRKMAPFDQKFYFIINLACGGTTGFFSDTASNPTRKPWANDSPRALTDFWNARSDWLPTWHPDEKEGLDAALQVDYLRVWAL